MIERAAVLTDADGKFVVDPSAIPESSSRTGGERLTLQRHWEAAQDVKIEEGEGGMAEATRCCWPMSSAGPAMTGWNDRRLAGRHPVDRGRHGRQ